ncbi:hypothetical protein [Rhodomicrobium lacus]|uniref:hypothetical protein n=1 Tax=Rhodomicrobium lacus TaxID=2498452 RepID=UPI000F8CE87F|nr:hypothetical protein [Rhodomicrobium lacus]
MIHYAIIAASTALGAYLAPDRRGDLGAAIGGAMGFMVGCAPLLLATVARHAPHQMRGIIAEIGVVAAILVAITVAWTVDPASRDLYGRIDTRAGWWGEK